MSEGKRVLKKEKRHGCFFRFLLILLLVLALLALLAFAAWKLLVREPDMADVPAMSVPGTAEASSLPLDYARKEQCWTFLLVGLDKVGSNTDSLILVTYDVKNQTVNMASIPRDTCVDAQRRLKKINAAYANGGMALLTDEVTRTFGVPVDYYVKVDVQGFVALVDELGGIEFDVPCDMNYDDPAQGLSIHYRAGLQSLSGQQALEVCRFRHNNDNTGYNDTGRMETQRGVLTAIAKKLLSWGSLTRVSRYLDIASEHVDTSLSATDMAWFAEKALAFDTENLHTMMFPAAWRSPYMYLDPEATLQMVNECLNPYTTDLTADMLDIIP